MPPADTSTRHGDSREPFFGPRELEEARWLIRRAIEEDLAGGDLTTDALFAPPPSGPASGPEVLLEAAYVPREEGILCGVPLVRELFRAHAPAVDLEELQQDGTALVPGTPCLKVQGPIRDILRLERISLNFLGRLSAVASETHRWRSEIAGSSTVLLDTRKTTPGWRRLEKYAVRAGGGCNHRESLSDAILLKDNHADALRLLGRGSLARWIETLRKSAPAVFLEVEVATRQEFLETLDAGVDAILLDNFSVDDLRWAVAARRQREKERVLLEASGGLARGRLKEIAATGVDRISAGRLTHSAPSVDLGLDVVRVIRKTTSRGSVGQ